MSKRGGDLTSGKVWRYLNDNGPTKACHIAEGIRCTRASVYQALGRLMDMGKVERDGSQWHRIYFLTPGSTPPNDLRGLALGSRRALAKRWDRSKEGFGECALAQCWRLVAISNGQAD